MRDVSFKVEELRRELDLLFARLEHCGADLIKARSEGSRLDGDIFVDAHVVASRDPGQFGYQRLVRRAKVLSIALRRRRDGSYESCEECGGSISKARLRALPGVTTCLQCQELGEILRVERFSRKTEWTTRRARVRHTRGWHDASVNMQH